MSSYSSSEKRGVFLSVPVALLLVFLSLTIAVGVGVIVTFAVPRGDVKCECHFPGGVTPPTPGPEEQLKTCTNLATQLGECICPPGVSPGPPTTSPDTTQTTPTEPPTKPPITDFRLPTDIEPVHYTIELRPDIYHADPSQFKTTGSVSIRLHVVKATNVLILHGKNLTLDISTLEFKAEGATPDPGAKPTFLNDPSRQFLRFTFEKNLVNNGNYTFSVKFTAILEKGDTKGLYWSSYLEGDETRYLATTQFQATDARRAFPCFDEPGFKATHDVILVKKSDPKWKALANMPMYKREPRETGWEACFFNTTLKQSAYLLAMVVCDFDFIEARSDRGHLHRVWGRPSAIAAGLGAFALNVTGNILEDLEDYTGIPYPMPKTDQIAIPDFAAGAMENWGLVTYRESILFYDPDYSKTTNRQSTASIIGHELAHSWFGNLVTCKFWDDTWLNEAFATFMEKLPLHRVMPDWGTREIVVSDTIQTVMNNDERNTTQPIFVTLNQFPFEANAFSRITYSKGGAVLRMINYTLTEKTFKGAIQRYLKDNSYEAVTGKDLFKAFSDQAAADKRPLNATEKFSPWIYQRFFPVVKVVRSGARAQLSQTKFFIDPSETAPDSESPYKYQWNIPLTYTDRRNPTFYKEVDRWMDRGNDTINVTASPDDWYLLNSQLQGFYRVDYDIPNWRALIQQLKANHTVINANNRAQLLDDVFSLSRAGNSDVDAVLAFQLAQYMANDVQYITWRTLLRQKIFLSNMLARKSTYGAYQRFVKEIVDKAFKNINGLTDTDSDPHQHMLLRQYLIPRACHHEHTGCVDEAKALFNQWKADKNFKIRPNVKYTVFCAGVRHGTDKDWDQVYDFYRNIDVARNPLHLAEKNDIRPALSCLKEQWMINRFLGLATNETETSITEANTILIQLARSPNGRDVVWTWLRADWNTIRTKYNSAGVLGALADTFNTKFELQQVVDLQRSTSPPSSALAKTFTTVIAKVEANIRWMETNEKPLSDWLDMNYP